MKVRAIIRTTIDSRNVKEGVVERLWLLVGDNFTLHCSVAYKHRSSAVRAAEKFSAKHGFEITGWGGER